MPKERQGAREVPKWALPKEAWKLQLRAACDEEYVQKGEGDIGQELAEIVPISTRNRSCSTDTFWMMKSICGSSQSTMILKGFFKPL